jgi:AcrR family transcriptional regulator
LQNPTTRTALEPQRRHGKQRVAALLEAGAAVIEERGFEAATMAEIAARAGAPIGSLYRFFPNKQAVAEALFDRYSELLDLAFESISDDPAKLSTEAFADALLALLVGLHSETKALVVLLDARSDWSARRSELHDALSRHIARKLKLRNPRLDSKTADDMAVVVLQNMKAMKAMSVTAPTAEQEDHDRAGVIAQLHDMTRIYLTSKLDVGNT